MVRRVSRLLFPILFIAAAVFAEPARVQDTRLRPLDPAARRLLAEALERSPTVRDLVARIEASDLIVYLRVRFEPIARSTTMLLAASAGTRFVLVTLDPYRLASEPLPSLGHELQHATEIAAAPGVVNDKGMRALFGRIGFRSGRDSWETEAAVAAARRVSQDLSHPAARVAAAPQSGRAGGK